MCFVSKFVFNFFFLAPPFLIDLSRSTIDINFPEYQYIADHLTDKECHRLVAALHFHTYEIPKEIDAAGYDRELIFQYRKLVFFLGKSSPQEGRLPEDTPCIDLLLHWNSTPGEGKGQTHVEICRRLNQIGREDLAEWLSKATFHEISKDLKLPMVIEETDGDSLRLPNVTEAVWSDTIGDEAAWWTVDSVLSILLVFGLLTCLFGCCFSCILLCTKPTSTNTGYKSLSS